MARWQKIYLRWHQFMIIHQRSSHEPLLKHRLTPSPSFLKVNLTLHCLLHKLKLDSANQTRFKNSTRSRGNQTKKIKSVVTDSKAIQVSQIDHHGDRFLDDTALVDRDETRSKSRNSIDEITRLPTQLDLEENYINLTNNRNEEDFDSNDELLKFLYSKRREIIDDIQLIDSVLAQYH